VDVCPGSPLLWKGNISTSAENGEYGLCTARIHHGFVTPDAIFKINAQIYMIKLPRKWIIQ
jgi:hypothetical protein